MIHINSNNETFDIRPYKSSKGRTEHGRSTVVIECPFCQTKVTAYVWSLAGSGKKCPECGAIHGNYGKSSLKVEITGN